MYDLSIIALYNKRWQPQTKSESSLSPSKEYKQSRKSAKRWLGHDKASIHTQEKNRLTRDIACFMVESSTKIIIVPSGTIDFT